MSIPVRQTTDAQPDAAVSAMALSVLAAAAANPLLISRSREDRVAQDTGFSPISEQVPLAPAA